MNDTEAKALLEKVESLHKTLSQVHSLVHPARPVASELSFQCMQAGELAAMEVAPGKSFAQAGEEVADAVESIANLVTTASGSVALLLAALQHPDR